MSALESLAILEALANAADPRTGELLAEEHVCRRPDVTTALQAAARFMADAVARESRLPPPNTGKPWTAEETRGICEGFDHGRSIEQLMETHGRTRGAVITRLRIGGRLPWPEAT